MYDEEISVTRTLTTIATFQLWIYSNSSNFKGTTYGCSLDFNVGAYK